MILWPVYGTGLGLAFYMAWCLGANDAANPCNCVVGAGVYSMRKALYTFAIFAALGGILFGPFVMKTIDRGLVDRRALGTSELIVGSLSAALAACLWVTLSTWLGMPVSTTHSTMGGVLGFALVTGVAIRSDNLMRALFSIPVSPLIALGLAAFLYSLLARFFAVSRKSVSNLSLTLALYLPLFMVMFFSLFYGIWHLESLHSLIFAAVATAAVLFVVCAWVKGTKGIDLACRLLILVHFLSAFVFGANDMANATGVFVTPTERLMGVVSTSAMFLLSVLGAVGIALGGFTWGYKVIDTAAYKVTRLNPITGLAAEYAQAFTVLVFTTVPVWLWGFGIPISTSLSNIGTVVGVGLASKGLRGVEKSVLAKIMLFWVITIPVAALLSGALFKLLSWAV
jgi:PiT family inorganic phosphate transporter